MLFIDKIPPSIFKFLIDRFEYTEPHFFDEKDSISESPRILPENPKPIKIESLILLIIFPLIIDLFRY